MTEQPVAASRTVRGRVFLFLQGPITPFFKRIADGLEARGHGIRRINLCFGDWLFWRRAGATNYRGKLQNWPAFISAYMDRERVTDLVLLGEQREYHKAAIRAAHARAIKVVTSDFGYLRPDWITFEQDGMSADSRFPRDPTAIQAIARDLPQPDLTRKYRDSFFNMAVWDMAYHLSSTLCRVLYPFYRSHHMHHPIFVYLGTGIHLLRTRLGATSAAATVEALRRGEPDYFVFPLQMQNDFQIRIYSDFPSLQAAIRLVIGSFARHAPPNTLLVIKEHPLDPSLVNWRRFCTRVCREQGIADRLRFLNGGSLEDLLEAARGVVTINSTVGVWTLLANRPLMTLGQAIFDIPGLSFSGGLDRFWQAGTAPEPGLRDDFVKAIAGTIQLRGVYYNQPGLNAAVAQAVERLDHDRINQALPDDLTEPAAALATAG
jgi:capsular polysaccharide export protein